MRPSPGDRIKPKKPAKVQFASTTLLLEAFLVVFATLVAYGLRDVPYSRGPLELPSATSIWVVGGMLAVVLVGLGVSSLSMTARAIPDVAALLREVDVDECRRLARIAVEAESAAEARAVVRENLPVLAELGL